MSDNHQSYSVMTTQAMAHSASLISHSAMNVDVDDPSQKLGQLSPHASSTSSQSPIIYDASQLGFTTPSSTTYIPQPPSVPFTGRPHTSLSLVQLRTSSIGPERVTRRQQARAHQQQTTSQALSVDNGLSQEAQFDDGLIIYSHNSEVTRPHTPNRFHIGSQFAEHYSGASELGSGGNITGLHYASMSPPHPSTPASVTSSSGHSHYGFHPPYGTHSRSTSSSTHHRSASPAISIISAVTSLSSNSSKPRPALSTTSISPYHSNSKPKKRLTNKERKAICNTYMHNPNCRQEDIASQYGVERSTVSKILKHKSKWLSMPEGEDSHVAKHRPSKFPEIEQCLQEWLLHCRHNKTIISDVMIRTKAREVAREMDIGEDKFKASAGWVENFKHRQGIKKGVWNGLIRNQHTLDFDVEFDEDSDTENLNGFKLRSEAIRTVDELRAPIDLQPGRDQIEMEVVNTNTQHHTPLDDPKMNSLVTGHWASPLAPTLEGISINFPEVPSGTMPSAQRDMSPHLSGEQNQHRPQQSVLDCRPPSPYQSNGSQTEVLSQGAPTLTGQDVIDANILQFPIQQTPSRDEVQIPLVPTPPWTSGPRLTVEEPVTAQEATLALEKVVRYLKDKHPNYLTSAGHNVITDIQHLIWLSAATNLNLPTTSEAASANPITQDLVVSKVS